MSTHDPNTDVTETASEREERHDSLVLSLLLLSPWPWSVEEIGRELYSPDEAIDAVARLAEAGLVHHLDNFAFPTRAARRSDQLHHGSL